MTLRSFCVHAHFYQPPREDPLSGLIPNEVGATPYPNWNERIYAECYRPNAELGNFERISFNIGPTLWDWMAAQHPQTCRQVVAQDQANLRRYGVGNAIAQPYHHVILPLAPYQDKVTQVAWGVANFTHHFGRKPQGMWLPETAVDYETLCVLADQGIEFTILAPWQAKSESLDVTEPYWVQLPGGRRMTIFFYHSGLSSDLSFNPAATLNADHFALNNLVAAFDPHKTRRGEPQLLLLASDGELYGHHQPYRDHFLAHLVNGASERCDLQPTFPALWLKEHPPRRQVEIYEKTSWSCHHGVRRWMGTCGCVPGDSRWKTHLRRALDRLARDLDAVYLRTVGPWVADPWVLRNEYIQVVLEGRAFGDWLAQQLGRRLSGEAERQIHLLLKAQWERQRMFTSCGWFFEDFDRIEPQNNVAYAAQALLLTRMATGVDLIDRFSRDLMQVVSRRSGLRGDQVFGRYVKQMLAMSQRPED
jgi:alpha-amylase/alpha-mannosidase (GH57 family)